METVAINSIHKNPGNPRIIRDDKFKKLVKSLNEFPEMMNIRPVVVNKAGVILGGNMRYEAAKVAGWREIPVEVVELAPEKEREFIIKDNVSGGEWDFDALVNGWEVEELTDWVVDIPISFEEPIGDELIGENKNKPATMKITFPTSDDLQKCESEIQEVINRICPKAFYSVSAGEI